jgi:hypothetical protein
LADNVEDATVFSVGNIALCYNKNGETYFFKMFGDIEETTHYIRYYNDNNKHLKYHVKRNSCQYVDDADLSDSDMMYCIAEFISSLKPLLK